MNLNLHFTIGLANFNCTLLATPSLHKPWVAKFLADRLGREMPIGETRWDFLVKVHDNSQFIYRAPQAQMVQKFMKMDYVFLLALISAFLPSAWFGLILAIPCCVYAV